MQQDDIYEDKLQENTAISLQNHYQLAQCPAERLDLKSLVIFSTQTRLSDKMAGNMTMLPVFQDQW